MRKTTLKQNNIVEVIRHIRGFDQRDFTLNSRGGLTAICHLDYTNNVMVVYPSVCSKTENYSKSLGIKQAKENRDNGIGFIASTDMIVATSKFTLQEIIRLTVLFPDEIDWLNGRSEKRYSGVFKQLEKYFG